MSKAWNILTVVYHMTVALLCLYMTVAILVGSAPSSATTFLIVVYVSIPSWISVLPRLLGRRKRSGQDGDD